MPNHVLNKWSFRCGTQERLEELLESIRGDDDPELKHIDFDKIIAMPEHLDTSGPYNPTQNPYLFSIEDAVSRTGISPPSYDNEYAWRCEHWGTKWNAYWQCRRTDKSRTIEFTTAWSMPSPVLFELAKINSDIEINAKWLDEDIGHNVGEIRLKSEDILYQNIPESGSNRAFELAFRIDPAIKQEYTLTRNGYMYNG